jgi:predicted transcriptional regulator
MPLDVIEASAKVLTLAANGTSHTGIMAVHQHLKQDEIGWLLKMLVNKSLLEIDSSSTYWTTVEGSKFLELQFQIERILETQKSLV